MAIELNLDRHQTESKFPFPHAYAKIHSVQIDTKANDEVIIYVYIYGDMEARNSENTKSVDKKIYYCSLTTLREAGEFSGRLNVMELHKAAYNYLKIDLLKGIDII